MAENFGPLTDKLGPEAVALFVRLEKRLEESEGQVKKLQRALLNSLIFRVQAQALTPPQLGTVAVYAKGAPGSESLFIKLPDGTEVDLGSVASGSLADGDKGDITVSGSGATWTIESSVITFAKMQAISANVLLGNDASGTTVEEITCTAAGRAIIDDADATAQRTTLGLGTLATQSGTFSGTHSGTSSGTNTGDQTSVSGNAGTVTTNANLTGPITSTGNATAIAAQTGTGTTFAMQAGPTFTGTLTADVETLTGKLTHSGVLATLKSTQVTAPTVAAGAALGSSPTVSIQAGSTDICGLVNLTCGTSPTTGTIATVTFNGTYGGAPKMVLIAFAGPASAAPRAYISSITGTTFVITAAVAPTASAVCSFYYFVIE